MNSYRSPILLLAAVLLLQAVPASTSEIAPVPASESRIDLEIDLPNGELVRASVPEGQMITVQLHDQDRTYGFSPRRSASGLSSYEVAVYRVGDPGQAEERLDLLGLVGLDREETDSLAWGEAMEVTITGTARQLSTLERQGGGGSSSPLEPDSIRPKIGRCCVTCGNITACGCAVELSCGSCCSGSCC